MLLRLYKEYLFGFYFLAKAIRYNNDNILFYSVHFSNLGYSLYFLSLLMVFISTILGKSIVVDDGGFLNLLIVFGLLFTLWAINEKIGKQVLASCESQLSDFDRRTRFRYTVAAILICIGGPLFGYVLIELSKYIQ